ncbi:MAG TPA: hypothetical protein VN366_04855 [Feifaniaceae bacterium]|nr:hypothetical protein [Feifaniaceae bacterium]
MKKPAALCLAFVLLLSGCASNPAAKEEAPGSVSKNEITSARELLDFFESGGPSARLKADIDLEDAMLKLTAARGPVEIIGGGHTVSGSAPCVIRLEDGCSIALNGISIAARQTGLGLLGSGTVFAEDTSITAQSNAIQAAGALTIAQESSLTLSGGGSGIVSLGLNLQQDGALNVSAVSFAVATGRGDITLYPRAALTCEAAGDNAVKTDGTLILMEDAVFTASNTGEHNGAKVGALQAERSATLNAKGGENGAGLFVVELYEDIALKGGSSPELKTEAGKGRLTFE